MRFGHTEVDVEHLLLALLDQTHGLIPRLLERCGVDVDAVRGDVTKALSRGRACPTQAPPATCASRALAPLLDDGDMRPGG